jgi:hypothetical protein
LLARQSELYGLETGMNELGRAHPALPDDLVNFHYDPVTAAVGLGWPGVTVEKIHLQPIVEAEVLRFRRREHAPIVDAVTDVNGSEFEELWLDTVARI